MTNERSKAHRLPSFSNGNGGLANLIGAMIKFWDSDFVVFRFGDVELTPAIEEVVASYESIGMCKKRRS